MFWLLAADGCIGMFLVAAFIRRSSRRWVELDEPSGQSFRSVLAAYVPVPAPRTGIHLVLSPPAAERWPAKRPGLIMRVLHAVAGLIAFLMRLFWVRVLGARERRCEG